MKAWIKKASGVLLAMLQTAMLNSKAYADLEPAPEKPVTEINESSNVLEEEQKVEVSLETAAPTDTSDIDMDQKDLLVDAEAVEEAGTDLALDVAAPVEVEISTTEAVADLGLDHILESPVTIEIEPTAIKGVADPLDNLALDGLITAEAEMPAEEPVANQRVDLTQKEPVTVETETNVTEYSTMDSDVELSDETTISETTCKPTVELPTEMIEPMVEILMAEPSEPVATLHEVSVEMPVPAEEPAEKPAMPLNNVPLETIIATPEIAEVTPAVFEGEAPALISDVLISEPTRILTAESGSTITFSETADAENESAACVTEPDLSTALRTAPLAKNAGDMSSDSPSGVLRRLDDGTYIMVGYQDNSAVISTQNSVLTVLAAGLNKISSLSSGGSINIGGTGILLVDSLQYGSGGSLNLMPNTEMYGEDGGSVAVFCKKDGTEKDYVFVNGMVPGRLDEAYTVEGCNLILPCGSKLILSSVGQATNIESQEVTYYSGEVTSADSDPLKDLLNYDKYFYEDETAASLTIGKGASFVVESGAEVESVVTPCLSKKTTSDIIAPSLKVTDNGILNVNGNLNGGVLSVGEGASLKGSGTVSAEQMVIHSPSCLGGSDVTLCSHDCTIYGSGTIDTLKLNGSNVFLNSGDGSVTINNIVSSSPAGSPNELIAGNSMTLGNISLTGNLALLTANGYGQSTVVSTLQGKVSGGTLSLGSGTYQLVDGFSCSASSLITDNSHVIVYDYSDGFAFSANNFKAPLLVDPGTVTISMPGTVEKTEEGQTVTYYKVPVVKVEAWESGTGNAGLWFDIKEVELLAQLDIPVGQTGTYLKELHETLTSGSSTAPVLMYELQYLENGIFRTVFFTDPTIDNSFSCFSGENLYLIRVSELMNFPGGQGGSPATSTQTSYTGSGVLGGSGAGSITIGGVTYNLSSATDVNLHPTPDPTPTPDPDPDPQPTPDPTPTPDPDPDPQPTPDPDPDPQPTPDPDPDPQPTPDPDPDPQPTPDPDPAPLVAFVEENTEPELVWVEVAPAVNNNAASPVETQYVLLALEGEKTLEELGGKATVSMNYTLPEEYAGKQLYIVFRDKNNKLVAFRARYSNITGLLRFITDRLGTFMIVGLDFDVPEGEEFPEEFYEALSQLAILENLKFAEYSPA